MNNETLSKIVVGVDFNELSTAALRFAAAIAGRAGAEVAAIYADTFEPPAEFTSSQVRSLVEKINRTKARTLEQLQLLVAATVPAGVTWTATLAEGAPADALARAAEKERAGLVVLGTHGRGGLERLMMGSVAEAVIRGATVPVLTVRTTPAPLTLRRILCPVNGSAIARFAAERAAQMARAVGAEITLLNIAMEGEVPLDEEALLADGVEATFVRRRTSHDDVSAEILATEADDGFDLIVIGAEHKRMRDVTAFGTTTTAVTRHARTPVLTVTRRAVRTTNQQSKEVAAHVV